MPVCGVLSSEFAPVRDGSGGKLVPLSDAPDDATVLGWDGPDGTVVAFSDGPGGKLVPDCDGPGGTVVVAWDGGLGGIGAGPGLLPSKKYPTPPNTARPATPAPINTGNLDDFACCAPVPAPLGAGVAGGAIDAASDEAEISTGLGCCAPAADDRDGMTIVASLLASATSAAAAGAAAAALIAAMNSAADAKRSSGRFAIALRTTASNGRGTVTEICDGIGASVFSALCIIADILPSNGRSPVSN